MFADSRAAPRPTAFHNSVFCQTRVFVPFPWRMSPKVILGHRRSRSIVTSISICEITHREAPFIQWLPSSPSGSFFGNCYGRHDHELPRKCRPHARMLRKLFEAHFERQNVSSVKRERKGRLRYWEVFLDAKLMG